MPIPKVQGNEKEETYVSRCMSAIGGEYEDNAQAVAICYATYRKATMQSLADPKERVAQRLKFNSDFRGINLQDGMENDPCWSGYQMIGTKEMDGREVPNCVPIKEEMAKIASEKGIDLQDYPWDECIADQTARYGDEETAKRVCGYIKSEYGGGE